MNEIGLRTLGGAIKTNTTLTGLSLSSEQQAPAHRNSQTVPEAPRFTDNNIGEEGLDVLREALQRNTALTQLGWVFMFP